MRLAPLIRPLVPRRYVVIHGFYGVGNVGDEAILAATLEAVRRVTDLEPFVFAWDAARVRSEYGVGSLVPHRSPRRDVLRVLLQSGALLLGGGGLLKDYGPDSESLFRWLRPMRAAQQLGVRTMTWSVGVENLRLPASIQRVRTILQRVDCLTVRDEGSAERLRALGVDRPVRVTADPVCALAQAWRPRRSPPTGAPRVAVALRHWYTTGQSVADASVFDHFLTCVAEACDALHAAYGATFSLIPLRTKGGDDDRLVAAEVARRVRSAPVRVEEAADPTPAQTLHRLCNADVVIAMRLHAAVMATSLGIPTLGVAYMPKVADYMASLGCEAFCTSVEAADAAWLTSRFREVWEGRDTLADVLCERTDRAARAFEENGRLLARLLPSPSLTPAADPQQCPCLPSR